MARYNNPKRTLKYTNEFKVKAVQLSLHDSIKVKEVAHTLDIHPYMLSRWRKEYREGVIMADKRAKTVTLHDDKAELNKVKKLEKENARLRLENDLLKKWQRFLAEQHQTDINSSRETEN